jgi:hypothetical protein
LLPTDLLKFLESAITHAKQLASNMAKIKDEKCELEEKMEMLKLRGLEVERQVRSNTRVIRELAGKFA